jgi:hypothetical protein
VTEGAVERFPNYIDGPDGELWTVRIRSTPTETVLLIGEADRDPFDIVLDGPSARAFASYVRAASEAHDSEHHSVDSRQGEWAYFHVTPTSNGQWRLMFSRDGGDVELEVDEPTMRAIVDAITSTIDPRSENRGGSTC